MLDQKTIGFALAPYSLWCRSDTADERRRQLDGAVRRLNAAYFHWQLLDDVADINGDTRHGLVTGPGFILLSQGGIASRHLEAEDAPGQAGVMAAEIDRSRLLCEQFAASPLCDCDRQLFPAGGAASPADAQQLVRCALANREGDLDRPLAELCAARDRQAQGYLAAMKSRDWSAARRHLDASGASVRIMLAAQEDATRETARTELQRVDDQDFLKTLDIIEMLTRHCGAKACRLVMRG